MFLEVKGKPLVSLELGQLYMIGKQINGDNVRSKNFIELDDEEYLSQRHCVIETNQNGEAFVFDLLSLKGTLLNDKILNSLEKTLLKNGDILKIGYREIKYIYQGHDVSHDSSGFLEVQKNTSDIIASSPESISHIKNRAKNSDDHNFLLPALPSTSFSSRRSDSFTIPETQYCKQRNSLNNSDLSIAESLPDNNDGNKEFSFGNSDSFEDDDFCIPETQELLSVGGIPSSQRPRLLTDAENRAKQTSILEEEPLSLEKENTSAGSQFRICTQDYNEGFGEEETNEGLHSQIIPIIKHPTVILNKSMEGPNVGLLDQTDKEMSALEWSTSKTDQDTKELRSECVTPDIFEFEGVNIKELNKNIEKISAEEDPILIAEDEEDLLPTQCLPTVLKKVNIKKVLNEGERSCLDKEVEDVLILSDKENRQPTISKSAADIPTTQLEANAVVSHTSISHGNSISSVRKESSTQENRKSSGSFLNIEPNDEDDLLTQAFLQPKIVSVSSYNKNLPNKCFNSTLLDDKCTEKTPATFFTEMEKTPLKQMPASSANVFKKPDKDFSILRKTASTSSTASENDIDLLMCTPQFIKDNMTLEKPEDLRKHILAVKNRNLFGDETEDEDDDEQSDLVKLINIPKSSLDFDKLLPHLNKKPEDNKEEHDKQIEAQKIYKFNISFGKEQDEKHAKPSTSQSSSLSRDERHAARDKEKEVSLRKGTLKTKSGNKALTTKHKLEEIVQTDKKMENKNDKQLKSKRKEDRENERKKEAKKEENTSNNKTNDSQKKNEKKERKKESKKKVDSYNNKTDLKQKKPQVQISTTLENKVEEVCSEEEKSVRLRKRKASDNDEKKESKIENKQQPIPARRMTRLKSKFEEISSTYKTDCEDDDDNIPTQPIVKVARARSKPRRNDSPDSISSKTSSKTNESQRNRTESNPSTNSNVAVKKTERKRRAEATTDVLPPKIGRTTRLRSMHSQESLPSSTSSITVSMTSVDQELFKNLLNNSKGLWSVAANPADCDILVMDKPFRTFKFLLALSRGIPIVTSDYLKKLNDCKSSKEVRLIDYHFSDKEFEKKYKFSLSKALQASKKQKIFKDIEFLLTASIVPIPQEIKAIIEASGGFVHNKTPPQPKENQKLYLVSAKEDKKDWHKYRRSNKNIIIVSTEAIMSAVMTQSFEKMKNFLLA